MEKTINGEKMILVFIIVGLLFFIVGYGLYLTVGPGKVDLRDPIDEHAKMHELGIAHGHGGNKDAYEVSGKLTHSHNEEQCSQKKNKGTKLNLNSITSSGV